VRPSVRVLDIALPVLNDLSGATGDLDEKPGEVDYSAIKLPTFNQYLVALTHILPGNSKVPEPLAIALQLGNLISTTAVYPNPDDWSETDFIALLNPLDLSL
jgi:hypothetical protein